VSTDDVNARTPTNRTIDDRVARVESDVGTLRTEFGGFQTLINERFQTVGDTLRRIESAVTSPNAADATTLGNLTDHARRITDLERKTEAQATEQTSLRAQINTVGAGVRWVGFGGAVTIISLIAGWVVLIGGKP
jgi:hypothetical protein